MYPHTHSCFSLSCFFFLAAASFLAAVACFFSLVSSTLGCFFSADFFLLAAGLMSTLNPAPLFAYHMRG
jgi:hypothetical protein